MDTSNASLTGQGIQALQSGHLAQAIDLLNQALRQNPNDALTATYLGIAHCRQKDFETGIPMLTQATQLQPANATFQYNLAVGLYQAGRKEEAKAAFERALAIDPHHAQAQAALTKLQTELANANPSQPTSVPPQQSPTASPPHYQAQWLGGSPPPQPYPQPPVQPSPIYPTPTGTAYPPSAPGLVYNPQSAAADQHPSITTRLVRGLGWGALYGQWWTFWNIFWFTILSMVNWNGPEWLFILILTLVLAVVFGIAGSLLGLLLGAIDADPDQGALIGIGVGLVFWLLEILITHFALLSAFINFLFWMFTGRRVGRMIARKIQDIIYDY